ncbi:MAG: DMT family transporter [Acidimicrobiales bacterium]|nr:DMT family transporter [Acidimicrobiales bacterium]
MQRRDGIGKAFVAMSLVGAAVTASTYLADGRITAQALRYAATAVVLLGVSRRRRRRDGAWQLRRPRGSGWLWSTAAATCGLTVYNLALVEALQRADTPLVASIVSAVPLVLAVAAPVAVRQPVAGRIVAGATIVVAGSMLIYGTGRAEATGVVLAVVALGGECAFTLFGARSLASVGAVSIATHTAWIAAAQLAVLSLLVEDGTGAGWDLGAVAAIGYLVVASAAAFVLWFDAIDSIGPAVAGLTAGAIPIVALISGGLLGTARLTPASLAGVAIVIAGIATALRQAAPSTEVTALS